MHPDRRTFTEDVEALYEYSSGRGHTLVWPPLGAGVTADGVRRVPHTSRQPVVFGNRHGVEWWAGHARRLVGDDGGAWLVAFGGQQRARMHRLAGRLASEEAFTVKVSEETGGDLSTSVLVYPTGAPVMFDVDIHDDGDDELPQGDRFRTVTPST